MMSCQRQNTTYKAVNIRERSAGLATKLPTDTAKSQREPRRVLSQRSTEKRSETNRTEESQEL